MSHDELADLMGVGSTEELLDTTFALAYREAVQVRRAAEEEARQAAERRAAALAEEQVYDPMPYAEAMPHEPRMYEGTGIGCLYGLPDCERFLPELGDWTIVRGGR